MRRRRIIVEQNGSGGPDTKENLRNSSSIPEEMGSLFEESKLEESKV